MFLQRSPWQEIFVGLRLGMYKWFKNFRVLWNRKGDFVSESGGAERNFEKLSKAITEAVMVSPKVKKIVAEIQKNEEICPKSFMVLVLKMEVLTDSFDLEVEEELTEEQPTPKKRASRKSLKKSQFIDGQQLSKKEIEFQEYSSKKFNTEKWLKKNGLIL